MAKAKTSFFCSDCGHEASGWLGKCPGCGAWNTLVEERTVTGSASTKPSRRGAWLTDDGNTSKVSGGAATRAGSAPIIRLDAVKTGQNTRLSSGLSEFDRVLGGGFVRGSLILLGGDPGIGKSTLLLQVLGLLPPNTSTLYISGEESAEQIRLRADRLGTSPDRVSLLSATDFETVAAALEKTRPQLAIVDSIQTLYVEELSAAPGSVSQVRESAAGLLRIAKGLGITIVLVGHVTKDGAIAGPRVLEHMVDTVLYFEGERHQDIRMLRAVKNRFGATDELGLFEMTDVGLVSVLNASEALLSGRPLSVPGSVITACLEGTRPLLVELQALMNASTYAAPLRMAQGIERNRLSMLLAVVEKQLGLGLGNLDAYLNVVGGLKVSETAADLAIISAVVSSVKNKPVKSQAIIIGEVGLTGEVRAISQLDRRVSEASRLGFKRFIVPASNRQSLSKVKLPDECEIYYVDRMTEAMDIIF
ncbi:MAG: DNA repair protein RadA [Eubacteriales bacterium]|nr:DNA repair protein RadA [Eubacteriales bacterium]